ncbi:hypothetical protein GNZ12_34105 [Paraburkholderia sp. 1N]|uniref:Uncharacterized protein n=1 Tax=Paraburkholderia solitsugae TaxID=2675748 RepID=A0ABX2BR16_9BURK|nr:hypothetical protein [Paraburkholderia solitsugae]NPT42371.1 hypothetical protein [Paraburkholderia solitsugae]NPT46272.1 hypothetical protein [Paraburkholderia solitsugae]
MTDRQHKATADLNVSTGVLIIRLEYETVREDGMLPSGGFIEVDGVYRTGASEGNYCLGGGGRATAHWAVFLFPRDALGNVFGWLLLSDSPVELANALHGMPADAIPWQH